MKNTLSSARHAIRAACLLLLSVALSGCSGPADSVKAASHDLAITNATIVDGTGKPAYKGTVLIRDGRFAAVGNVDTSTLDVARTIDAAGKVLAPGFIDMHSHGDPVTQSFENFLAMGVTSVVLGQDGSNPVSTPLKPWLATLEADGALVNVLALAGHGSIRREAGIPDEVRKLDAAQSQRLAEVLDASLSLGLHGMSTGLEYVPGIYSEPSEIVALGKVINRHGGILISHMRSEDDDKIEASIRELVSHNPDGRVHISHLKDIYGKGAERAKSLLDFIENLVQQGHALTADAYPYTAGYTWIGIVFPEWALPPTDYAKVMAERRDELAKYLQERVTGRGGPEAILFGTAPYPGKTLAEVAAEKKQSFVDVLIELGPEGASAAHFTMDATLQDALVASMKTALSTDGGPGLSHPRSSGTYARLIEHFVVKTGQLSLEDAVYKASGLPARIMGLPDRGTIKVGQWADAVLFDPASVRERSTYVEPHALAEGFDLVLVNGLVARENGRLQEKHAGTLVKPAATE